MATLLKNRCTEYSAYDLRIFMEDIPEELYTPDVVFLLLLRDNDILKIWFFSPDLPLDSEFYLTNPINFTIPSIYNERVNKNKKSEIRTVLVIADYPDDKRYTREFSYWVDGAFIRPEDSGLMNTLAISDLNVGTEGGEPTLT